MSRARSEIEYQILRQIRAAPEHSTRLKHVKSIVTRMVETGLLYRFKAMGQTVPLMVGITQTGQARLDALKKAREA